MLTSQLRPWKGIPEGFPKCCGSSMLTHALAHATFTGNIPNLLHDNQLNSLYL